MKTCLRCGGSWKGREFNTLCAHDFGEAPEPQVFPVTTSRGEVLYYAEDGHFGGPAHPTREGAISAWKAEWTRRRDEARSAEPAPDPSPRALPLVSDVVRAYTEAEIGDRVIVDGGRRGALVAKSLDLRSGTADASVAYNDGATERQISLHRIRPERGIKYPDGSVLTLTVTDSSGPDGADRTFPVTITTGTWSYDALKCGPPKATAAGASPDEQKAIDSTRAVHPNCGHEIRVAYRAVGYLNTVCGCGAHFAFKED